MFRKFTILFVIFCAVASTSSLTKASNWNAQYTQIADEEVFRNYIVGKVVTGVCTVVLGADNKVRGNCSGKTLKGSWKWSGKHYCSEYFVGGKKYEGCKKLEFSIKDKKIRTTSLKDGRTRISTLTNITTSSPNNAGADTAALEAEKLKAEKLQQELAALQAKQASAQPVVH